MKKTFSTYAGTVSTGINNFHRYEQHGTGEQQGEEIVRFSKKHFSKHFSGETKSK